LACALAPVFSVDAVAAPLEPRATLPKSSAVERPAYPARVVVKFHDALRVRSRAGALASDSGADLVRVEAVAARHGLSFTPLIELSEGRLSELESRAAVRSGRAQPDLAGMFVVSGAEDSLQPAARNLLGLEAVEWVAWQELMPEPPCTDLPPETPHYFAQGLQTFQVPQGGGLDVRHAWSLGARGAGVQIADCEYGYIGGTEDLCGIVDEPGQTPHPSVALNGWDNHGSAALAVIAGLANRYGLRGVAPDAKVLFFPEWTVESGGRRVTAITNAIDAVDPGDVVVLEMQAMGPGGGYGPAELDPAVWTVVRLGADAGVVVVGAAGNGNQNLDSAAYAAYMARGDSGAILVGSGSSNAVHQKLQTSSHGSRVDVQGWGQNVFTAGYGSYATVGGDARQRYTATFGGTSSATAVVAAAAALVQSAALAERGCKLDPGPLRQVLIDTGHPQGGPGGEIGPFPDLVAALDAVIDGAGGPCE
jgi:subtilisin family serine protease